MIQSIKSIVFNTKLWHSSFKNKNELRHWTERREAILSWYRCEKEYLFPFPSEDERVSQFDETTNALLTFIKKENEHASYLKDLLLHADSFRGLKVADIGSGPFPTLLVFNGCERYCIDHLIEAYEEMGYPLSPFKSDVHFLNAKSEAIPVPSGFFDVVISRNALDHVDDFAATAKEIRRVLKSDGVLQILVNYHEPTATEPHVLSDAVIRTEFSRLNLRKLLELRGAWGFRDGRTVLWSNAPASILNLKGTDERDK